MQTKIFTVESEPSMIRSQLQRIKESRMSKHIQTKRRILFGDTSDLDDETILEAIPIQTPFTKPKSLNFDRQRHTMDEEEKFNIKFSKFLKTLVRYGDVKDVEYLFDYLVRRYSCDTFNQKEMIFFLLPFKKYYSQVLSLSSTSGFNYFIVQPTYSYQFIGNVCLKDKCFFDFLVGYFEYFEHVREFCTEVLRYIVPGVRNTDSDFSMQFFEIISSLVKCGESLFAVELFFEIRDHIQDVVEDFIELLLPFFDRGYLMRKSVQAVESSVDTRFDDDELFREMYDKQEDRGFLKDRSRYKNYVIWLTRSRLPLSSFSDREYEALKVLCGISRSRRIGGDVKDYLKLFEDLVDRSSLIGLLYENFPNDVYRLIPYMNDNDKVYLSRLSPELFHELVTQENHSEIVKNIRRGFLKDNLNGIMRTCLGYVCYDSSLFLEYLNEEVLLTLMMEIHGDVFVENIISTARAAGIDLVGSIVKTELYFHPGYLDYISEGPRNLDPEVNRKILVKISENPTDSNMSSLCRYLHHLGDSEFINEVTEWMLDRSYFHPVFYSSLKTNLELLSAKNCERILELRGTTEENYFILDRLYNIGKDVVDECLAGKDYKAVMFLCKRYGYSTVLGDRRSPDVIEFVNMTSRESLNASEMEAFVFYSSTLILTGGCEIMSMLLRREYIPYLIKCSRMKEWKLVKVIVSESLVQHPEYAQCCFDYFVGNYFDFEDDIDLLDTITQNGVSVDNEKLVEIFMNSPSYFKAEFVEVLLKNTSFDPLRFIPSVVPSMIEHNKRSVGEIFKRYGNVMGIYVGDVLISFPSIEDDMLEIDVRYLLAGAIKAYKQSQDARHLDFMYKAIDRPVVIPPQMSEKIAQLLNDNICHVRNELLLRFFRLYLESHKEPSTAVQNLLNTIYVSNRKAFFDISNVAFSLCHGLFKRYMDEMVGTLEDGNKDVVVFITNYLYWDPTYALSHRKLFVCLFKLYCRDPDAVYARCIGSVLRHNPQEIEAANDVILSHMKGDKIIMIIELLQILYQKVYEFKRCLVKSSPYLALVVDSTRKDVAKAARKLFEIIEKKHKKSGYQILRM